MNEFKQILKELVQVTVILILGSTAIILTATYMIWLSNLLTGG